MWEKFGASKAEMSPRKSGKVGGIFFAGEGRTYLKVRGSTLLWGTAIRRRMMVTFQMMIVSRMSIVFTDMIRYDV